MSKNYSVRVEAFDDGLVRDATFPFVATIAPLIPCESVA
jgi:hypothetical protein